MGVAEALPSGLYDGSGIQEYLEAVLADPDRVNDFRLLDNELFLHRHRSRHLRADHPGRRRDWDDVPISRAVAASTALPMVYKPVEIKGRHLVDGGLRSTTNVDVAVEAGAKFVIVVNPLVPYVNDFQKVIPTMLGSRVRRVRDMGFPQIGYQAFKLIAHQRLHEAVAHWKERYPGVDIILIEPDPNDELMFETNILNFTRRVEIARHGFESVTLRLAVGLRRASRRSAPSTGSRSRPPACARWCASSPRSASARPAGGGSSSRPPARCCARPTRPRAGSPSAVLAARAAGDRWRRRRGPWPRMWSSAPSGPPGATITPWSGSLRASSGAAHAAGAPAR